MPSGSLAEEVESDRVRTVMLNLLARSALKMDKPSVPVA